MTIERKPVGIGNQLIQGDCIKGMKELPDGCIDLTVTSPPWDNIFRYGGHGWSRTQFESVATELLRLTKPGGVVCWDVADGREEGFCTGSTARQTCFFLDLGFNLFENLIVHNHRGAGGRRSSHGLPPEQVLVFSKGKPKTAQRQEKPNRPESVGTKFTSGQRTYEGEKPKGKGATIGPVGKRTAIWTYCPTCAQCGAVWSEMPNCPECHALWSGETTFNTWPSFEGSSIVKYTYNKRPKYLKDHPAPMNPSLVADLILAYSKPGEIVLEPFAGTGTTPVQAIKAGRRFRAYEINDKYFKLATRWIDETWVKSQEKWSAGF